MEVYLVVPNCSSVDALGAMVDHLVKFDVWEGHSDCVMRTGCVSAWF